MLTNRVKKILPATLTLLLLAGCAANAPRSDAQEAAGPVQQELNGELLYQLLAGEFAGSRGDMDAAAEFYVEAATSSDDPRVAARAAHIALFAEHYDEAVAAINRWQALSPEASDEITRVRVLAMLHLGEVDAVVEHLTPMLMQSGKINDTAITALSHILQKEAEPETSLAVLRKLDALHPQQPRLMLLRARYEVNASRFDTAQGLVDAVLAMAPETGDAWLIKAQILAAQQNEDGAIEAVSRAVGLRSDDNQLRLQYARMLVQRKDYATAWQQFNILYERQPENPDVLLSLGLLSIEIGKIDLANDYLQLLIDKGHHSSQAHYYLGRIQQSQGKLVVAIANFERVEKGEYYLDAHIRAAGLLAMTGAVDQAMVQLQNLMAASASDNDGVVRLYLAQGEVLSSAQRNREAFNIYNTALKNLPENTDLLYARALTAEKLDMLDVAESDLRLVLIHEPENVNALNALGYTLADHSQRLQEAKSYILKAVALLPNDPSILDSLGWVYYRLGEYEESVKHLRKAFAQFEDAEIAAHLGEVLWVSGQTEEAGKIWQRGASLRADHPVLVETMKRFKQ
ncbi:MAG: tetratricopeptide repeat protein [Gammaproteobacteria bacterium]|nr:tetratricopeptide repeat protein [Gammaproteobacteria bacterium]